MLAPAGLSLLVTSWPDERERSHALGIYGAVVSAGFAAGAVIGGLLVQATWRLVFFVNVPVGVACCSSRCACLPPDPPRGAGGRLDVAGALAVTAGVTLLVLGVVRAGDTLGATQPAVLAAAAVLLLGLFIVRERRAGPLLTWPCSRTAGSSAPTGPDRVSAPATPGRCYW